MRIPTSFPLFGDSVRVEIVPLEEWKHATDDVAVWTPFTGTISLRDDLKCEKREQAYFHEMVHAILDGMGHKLSRNEAFVDQFASLLHQAITGARYSKPKPVKVA